MFTGVALFTALAVILVIILLLSTVCFTLTKSSPGKPATQILSDFDDDFDDDDDDEISDELLPDSPSGLLYVNVI